MVMTPLVFTFPFVITTTSNIVAGLLEDGHCLKPTAVSVLTYSVPELRHSAVAIRNQAHLTAMDAEAEEGAHGLGQQHSQGPASDSPAAGHRLATTTRQGGLPSGHLWGFVAGDGGPRAGCPPSPPLPFRSLGLHKVAVALWLHVAMVVVE